MNLTFPERSIKSLYLTTKASAFIKKENFPSTVYPCSRRVMYYLKPDTILFDRLFRRFPGEILPNNESIPIGSTHKQAIISLFGLQNHRIQTDPRWTELVTSRHSIETQKDFTDSEKENDRKIIAYLKTAAIARLMEMDDPTIFSSKNPLHILESSSFFTDNHICYYFLHNLS